MTISGYLPSPDLTVLLATPFSQVEGLHIQWLIPLPPESRGTVLCIILRPIHSSTQHVCADIRFLRLSERCCKRVTLLLAATGLRTWSTEVGGGGGGFDRTLRTCLIIMQNKWRTSKHAWNEIFVSQLGHYQLAVPVLAGQSRFSCPCLTSSGVPLMSRILSRPPSS
jgi:hypothetical protein